MPLYEYKCTKCNSIFEIIQKVNDEPLKLCIKCGGPVIKIISPPTLQFKGNGWYITDYANKINPKKDPKKEKNQPSTQTSQKDKKSSPSKSPKK